MFSFFRNTMFPELIYNVFQHPKIFGTMNTTVTNWEQTTGPKTILSNQINKILIKTKYLVSNEIMV